MTDLAGVVVGDFTELTHVRSGMCVFSYVSMCMSRTLLQQLLRIRLLLLLLLLLLER